MYIPKNTFVFWLKLPQLLWFFGWDVAFWGKDTAGNRIKRWFCFKNAWAEVIAAYKIRNT
jgi:hypothetical protein